MKRAIRFRFETVRLSLMFVCLSATSGCLSMPQFSTLSSTSALAPGSALPPESLVGVPTGPLAWDAASGSRFHAAEPEVADVESSSTHSENSSGEVTAADSEQLDRLRVAQRDDGPHKARLGQRARQGATPKLVDVPTEFQWKTAAKSTGNRDIRRVVVGHGGYRTLLIGSLAGNDPIAVNLAERLAKHVHESQLVLGGIQLTVVRNLNPDGAANGVSENENGVYLNRQMTRSNVQSAGYSALPEELQYLFTELENSPPQRVIHLQSIGREQGVVAHSSGSKGVASDVAHWVGFLRMELPGKSATGTLERYLSESEKCEIITFAFPQDIAEEEAWELYRDALLNLLMSEDFATRKLAREQKTSKAADLRGRND